jgi:tRNA(Ile)-lysidine synthase
VFRPNKKTPAAEQAQAIGAEKAGAAFSILESCRSLLLAVSGGSDSMALLHLVDAWRARRKDGVKIIVASIDHRLRSSSAQDCQFVANFCAAKNIPFVQLAWEGTKPVTGLQEAARKTRYKLLAQAARENNCEAIVTAHTLDDQAETVLMRLIRGSGINGLQAMAAISEKENMPLLRPLLVFERERLREILREAGIAWREDASNEDARYLRARLRRLIPQLAEEGLDTARLNLLAKKAARVNVALDHAAQNLFAQIAPQGLELSIYRAAPEEIRLRALKLMIASFHARAYPPADEALEDLDAAIMSGKARRTLGNVIFSSGQRYLRFSDENDPRSLSDRA